MIPKKLNSLTCGVELKIRRYLVKRDQPVPCAGGKEQTQRGGRAEAGQERRSWLDNLALALQLLHRACK